MLNGIEHCFTSIKNPVSQCIWLNSVKHQRNVQVHAILRNIGRLNGLPKLGNAFDKVMARFKKAENTEPQATEKTEPAAETTVQAPPSKVYLKALPLRTLEDVETAKREVQSGNILILKVSPLARKSVDDVKQAVSELVEFTQTVGGDIARLGEERVVITPAPIRIWREKVVAPNDALPTAA
jgi:SepF-like predicted cell division protein (DUF552 family)